MRILIIHQYFRTPSEGFGIRTYHIAKSFADRGHDVVVLSGHNDRSGDLAIENYRVHYFKIAYKNSFSFTQRLISFYRFVNKCKAFLTSDHQFDLAYVLTTPLSTAYVALQLKRKFGIPYAYEVGDLWPEVPIQLGYIKNKFVRNQLRKLEKRVYHEAQFLIGLSPPIADHILKTVEHKNSVHVAPNMADCTFFNSVASSFPFTEANPFRISYVGTFGVANDLKHILGIAEECKHKGLPIEFVLMGTGAHWVQLNKKSSGEANVHVLPEGGMKDVRELLDKSHAVLLTFRKEEILNTGCPNKLFDGLAAGKLIVSSFDGWIGDLIKENQCGFTYSHQPTAFFSQITHFISNASELAEYQQNSRNLACKSFAIEKITAELCDYLKL